MMRRVAAVAVLALPLLLAAPAVAEDTADFATTPAQAHAAVRTALSQQLVELGLAQAEADARVALLQDEEVVRLVQDPKQVGMGGIKDKTLIIIAVILIIPSVILLLAI